MSSPSREKPEARQRRASVWDLLTFERLLTGSVIHIIYWCGLAGIALIGFAAIGAAVGLSVRGEGVEKLIALPALVIGGLIVIALALVWRAMCEFFVAVFRISEDLHALRQSQNID